MPSTDRAPSIQFYPRDWMADPAIQNLTMEERGRFHWSWCCSLMTSQPGLASEDQWRRWMGYSEQEWDAHRSAHVACFKVRKDGVWVQRRTVAEREAQKFRQKKARKGADVTNEKRWGKVAKRRLGESLAVGPASALESKRSKDFDSVPLTERDGADPARVPLAAGSFANAPGKAKPILGPSDETYFERGRR